VPTLEVVRRVEAEPASVALLLAGPAMTETAESFDVVSGPPLRSSLGFSSTVHVREGAETVGRGRLRVGAGDAGGAELRVTMPDALDDPDATRLALTRFLDELARTAEARSSAA
jgi:hypothetical protein